MNQFYLKRISKGVCVVNSSATQSLRYCWREVEPKLLLMFFGVLVLVPVLVWVITLIDSIVGFERECWTLWSSTPFARENVRPRTLTRMCLSQSLIFFRMFRSYAEETTKSTSSFFRGGRIFSSLVTAWTISVIVTMSGRCRLSPIVLYTSTARSPSVKLVNIALIMYVSIFIVSFLATASSKSCEARAGSLQAVRAVMPLVKIRLDVCAERRRTELVVDVAIMSVSISRTSS